MKFLKGNFSQSFQLEIGDWVIAKKGNYRWWVWFVSDRWQVKPFQLHVATWCQTTHTHKPKECISWKSVAKNILICRKKYLFLLGLFCFASLEILIIKSFTPCCIVVLGYDPDFKDWWVACNNRLIIGRCRKSSRKRLRSVVPGTSCHRWVPW